METVRMYTSPVCPFCIRAERYLRDKGVTEIVKINIENDDNVRTEMMAITGRKTVPQIFIGQHYVGGFDDLVALDKAGRLESLITG